MAGCQFDDLQCHQWWHCHIDHQYVDAAQMSTILLYLNNTFLVIPMGVKGLTWFRGNVEFGNWYLCNINFTHHSHKYQWEKKKFWEISHWKILVLENTENSWPCLPSSCSHWTMDMMTSWNGNIFRVTVPLCGEFTGPGEFPTQRPVTRSFDDFFDLRLNKWLSKQLWGW